MQAIPVLHVPLDAHVCTELPEHCVAFGAQTPVHVPLTQAWFEHAAPLCHVPEASHVCGV